MFHHLFLLSKKLISNHKPAVVLEPLGLFPSGFHCFNLNFVGLYHHRRDHDYNFSKLSKGCQTQIWNPGVPNYIVEIGGLRLWNSHTYRSRFIFALAIDISDLSRIKASLILCVGKKHLVYQRGILSYADTFDSHRWWFIIVTVRGEIRRRWSNISSNCDQYQWKDALKFTAPSSRWNCVFHCFITGTCLQSYKLLQSNLDFSNLRNRDQFKNWDLKASDCDDIDCVMELCLHQFGFCWIEMLRLHVGIVKYWQQELIGFAQFWCLRNALVMFRWKSINMSVSSTWDATVKVFVVMLKRITKSKYLQKTLVRKLWCHCVYISELYMDTSDLTLRFVKGNSIYKL